MKLLKTLAVTTMFSGALVVACGSTTSNNPPGIDSGAANQDSGPVSQNDSGGSDGGGPACTPTGGGCGAGQACCAPLTGGGGTCIAVGAPCTGVSVGCSSPTSCGGGEVCCASVTPPSSTCQTTCAAGSFQLCTGNDCPAGKICGSPFTGVPVKVCINPPADAGPTDSGSTDSGTGADSSSDLDASDSGG